MVKKIAFTTLIVVLSFAVINCGKSQQTSVQKTSAEETELPTTYHPAIDFYDGWHLAVQAWSFNRFTFFEAIDKVASLGLSWIEAYPGQKLSSEYPDAKFDPTLPAELRALVKRKLKETGIRLINYGVTKLPNDEAECRKVFEFAKEFGIKTIMAEPREDALDLIEKLCQEYQIQVAIHNHPKPSYYWNPDKVLEVLKGRSKWLGACGDIGHWMRSGIDPLEALKKLEGRLLSLHFKMFPGVPERQMFQLF